MPTTLVVTNDFPPSIGGIESFVEQVCRLLGDVVVLTRDDPDATAADQAYPFPIHRRGRVLLPDLATRAAASRLLRRYHATRVVYGAAAPLGLLAGPLRRAGATRQLAISHGHETWWSRVPVARSLLRRIGTQVTAVSYISEFTRAAIGPALDPAARAALVRLAPPVDTELFRPSLRPPERPTVLAAGRFVRQKGFDTLLTAWARVVAHWPGSPLPELVLIGDGPLRRRITEQAARITPSGTIRLVGPVPHDRMPDLLARGHVFALPVRTRLRGLNPEGLGLVYAEAAACGLAVVAGDSGGTRDVVIDQETGFVVDPEDPAALADLLLGLLTDLARARGLGVAGRHFVTQHFSPATTAAVLRQVLDLG